MKLSITRSAALSAAFVAVSTRVFLDLAIDGGPIHNGVWIAALLGALPAIPYLLCIESVTAGLQPRASIRLALSALLMAVTLLDAARVLSVVVRTSGYLALEPMNAITLTLPVALAALWCTFRNGDAIGYAATLWTRVFPALMLLVILLQMRHYRAEWLCPPLGNGWGDIVNGGVRTSGWFVSTSAVLLACDHSGRDAGQRSFILRLALAPVIVALLLTLRLMMAPTGAGDISWISRLDALLTNGRAPLYLQLPMIVTFFIGLMHLLTCECFAASALLQRLIPSLDGRLCAAITVFLIVVVSFVKSLNLVVNGVAPWLFVIASTPLALAMLFQSRPQRGDRPCGS